MDPFALLDGASPWWWVAVGVGLTAAEIVTFSFFLLWPGLAALTVGLLLFAFPDLSGVAQIIIFAVAAIGFTVAGRFLVHRLGAGRTDAPHLNRRTTRLVGRVAVVVEPFEDGFGAVEVDGVRWPAHLVGDADAGAARFRVTGAEGMTLQVEGVAETA